VKTRCVAVSLSLLAPTPDLRAQGADLATIVERFCEIQTAGDMGRLRGLMTPDLVAVIDEAQARNAAVGAASDPDNTPLAAGVPYRSMAEMPASCAAATVSAAANVTIVDIAYAAGKGARWTDRLVLRPGADGMRIDDILFASFPTDTYKAGLRRVLADTFDD
jgi:hypothetical protein